MTIDNKIYVLTDYRLGNSNQALALAQALGIEYEVKHVSYNLFAIKFHQNCLI